MEAFELELYYPSQPMRQASCFTTPENISVGMHYFRVRALLVLLDGRSSVPGAALRFDSETGGDAEFGGVGGVGGGALAPGAGDIVNYLVEQA